MILFLVLLAALIVWGILIYNGLVGLRIRADNAWSDISVQLNRRYDLIPNIVETVKGYAGHEEKVFRQVTEARAKAMQAVNAGDKSSAEAALSGALKSLLAVAENYPQLRASENFGSLQATLAEIEDALQSARRYYNAVVRDYNIKTEVIPDRVIAGLAGFRGKEFFQLDSDAESKNPKVSFP